MGKHIDEILGEVDLILEKKASVKTKEVTPSASSAQDDAIKIANLLLSEDEHFAREFAQEKEASAKPVATQEQSWEVKLASALVIGEVLSNLEKFQKIDEFEKKASEAGFSQFEIDKFIVEKFL